MRTIIVPIFDEFDNYCFRGYREIKIKNKPTSADVNKITKLLPGIPQGSVGKEPLKDLLENGYKSVSSFYDSRQSTKRFKHYKIVLIPFKS